MNPSTARIYMTGTDPENTIIFLEKLILNSELGKQSFPTKLGPR